MRVCLSSERGAINRVRASKSKFLCLLIFCKLFFMDYHHNYSLLHTVGRVIAAYTADQPDYIIRLHAYNVISTFRPCCSHQA